MNNLSRELDNEQSRAYILLVISGLVVYLDAIWMS